MIQHISCQTSLTIGRRWTFRGTAPSVAYAVAHVAFWCHLAELLVQPGWTAPGLQAPLASSGLRVPNVHLRRCVHRTMLDAQAKLCSLS